MNQCQAAIRAGSHARVQLIIRLELTHARVVCPMCGLTFDLATASCCHRKSQSKNCECYEHFHLGPNAY